MGVWSPEGFKPVDSTNLYTYLGVFGYVKTMEYIAVSILDRFAKGKDVISYSLTDVESIKQNDELNKFPIPRV
jgi:hypothetical protein